MVTWNSRYDQFLKPTESMALFNSFSLFIYCHGVQCNIVHVSKFLKYSLNNCVCLMTLHRPVVLNNNSKIAEVKNIFYWIRFVFVHLIYLCYFIFKGHFWMQVTSWNGLKCWNMCLQKNEMHWGWSKVTFKLWKGIFFFDLCSLIL